MTEQPLLPFDQSALLQEFDPDKRLDSFFDLLIAENQRVNLVSRETSRADFNRMVAECLLPLTVTGHDGRFGSYLDIGPGGGFPLVPLLLSGRVGAGWACERTQKKATALTRILAGLGLSATVISRTFEEARFERQFALVTLRYIKLTSDLLEKIFAVMPYTGLLIYYSQPEFAIKSLTASPYRFQTSPEQPIKSFTLIAPK
ncbi:hypothetical protein GF420_10240 [candidate division GN15 bacterium]|nr:hypothetical protein [candidate division GN15 bacterium]